MSGILFHKYGGEDLDSYYPIRPECQADVPKVRFKARAGKTLSARRWHAAFSEDGHLDIAKVLRRIQRGGIHPSIKGLVWEFLLGCYDPNSTFEERNQIRQQRRDSLDQGWHVDGAISDKKVLQWMLGLHQIGLDVVRTDRSLVFYESETNQAKLWDVLAIYSWVDNDIGYVQGMNDICSPMIVLLENEADAFWCFEHTMRRLRENFRTNTGMIGVQSQLSTLSQIIRTIDPKLHQHLEDLDGGEYLFAFRMLMVLFRREFSFVDALYLWELMWAMEYNPNIFSLYESNSSTSDGRQVNDKQLKQCGKFERKNVKTGLPDKTSALSVFLVASVLETKNKKLLREAKGLDDVVKILADITGNLDAKKACNEALKIQKKYLSKSKK
ncbi:hypothetical protein CISIN_1g013736mg [Citrus sinensis]|uniref:Rab-GAP TBC domain-containing protein n=1 Tax=Citrus sinensis TaxID=2711 RepID=A0A067F2T0_CITSI|nr:hypothetical protein CISIN_1g013736mg [Citrus sinensis]